MGYLNVFQGGDVVDTEGENFHLNIQSLPKKVKVEKATWSRRRKTDMSVKSAPLKIDNLEQTCSAISGRGNRWPISWKSILGIVCFYDLPTVQLSHTGEIADASPTHNHVLCQADHLWKSRPHTYNKYYDSNLSKLIPIPPSYLLSRDSLKIIRLLLDAINCPVC